MANARVFSGTGDSSPDAWRRIVSYLLQSFSAVPEKSSPVVQRRTRKAAASGADADADATPRAIFRDGGPGWPRPDHRLPLTTAWATAATAATADL
jgi:hypothetical protein